METVSRDLRKALLEDTLGTANQLRSELVDVILVSFQDPNQWPMTDKERTDLLRRLYRIALDIKRLEEA